MAFLTAIAASAALAESCDRLANPIFDGGGYKYDFNFGEAGSYGEPREGGSNGPTDVPPGPVRTIDAWDDWGNVLVYSSGADLTIPGVEDRYSGSAEGCTFALNGQEIAYPVVPLHGLQVQHRWYVDPGPLHGARILTVLRNPTALPIAVTVTQGDPSGFDGIGSDAETSIRASSDGTATFSPASVWGITTDERPPRLDIPFAPDPALAHVWDGRGGAIRISQAVVGEAGALYWAWNVTVPPGRLAALISYEIQAAVLSRDRAMEVAEAAAQAEARQSQPAASLYSGMSAEEIAGTLNWPHPAPTATITPISGANAARPVHLGVGAAAAAAGLPQCGISGYDWTTDDGGKGTGTTLHHFFSPGRHEATLTVTTSCGATASAKASFKVGPGLRLGKVVPNRKNGTAKLNVQALGGGKLTLTGKGVKKDAKQLKGAGGVRLTVRPSGKILRGLRRSDKAKVRIKVSLRPKGGKLSSLSKTVTLKLG